MNAENGKSGEAKRWTNDKPMFFATLAGVVVVAASVLVAVWQVCETRRALSEAREANRIANAAMAGGDAASSAELRAYVFAIPGNVYVVSDGSRPEPRTLFRNSGKTFATEVRRSVGVVISHPLSPEQEAAFGDGISEEGSFVLSPNGADDVVIRKGDQLANGEKSGIEAGRLRLYVFGRVEYKDVFGKSHWTKFCHFFTGEMNNWGPRHSGFGFASNQAKYCSGHNEIDRE